MFSSFASPLAAVYFGGAFDGAESDKRRDAILLVVDLNVFGPNVRVLLQLLFAHVRQRRLFSDIHFLKRVLPDL